MDGPVRARPAPSAAVESLWRLEQIGPYRYRGWCREGAATRAFGGQVAAQALAAAGTDMTEDWHPNSLHAYFIREGHPARPIEYRVEHVDDNDAVVRIRRVTASQSGKPILTLEASFRVPHDDAGSVTPAPSWRPDLGTDPDGWTPRTPDDERWLAGQPSRLRFELRFVDQPSPLAGRKGEVTDGQRFWLRTTQRLPDQRLQHACALTYASDMFLVSTALARHGLPGRRAGIQAASLDHALWLHRWVRADDWLLYEQSSPTSAGGRGLSTGRILDREGQLVATIHQEVLLRVPA